MTAKGLITNILSRMKSMDRVYIFNYQPAQMRRIDLPSFFAESLLPTLLELKGTILDPYVEPLAKPLTILVRFSA